MGYYDFQLVLYDSSGTVFSSDALPTTALSLSQFDSFPNSSFQFVNTDGSSDNYVYGITGLTLSTVPEPSIAGFLCLSLVLVRCLRRRHAQRFP